MHSMSRQIERSEAIDFFSALRFHFSPLAFWSFDTSNGEQRSVEGYVNDVNNVFLEIEMQSDEKILVLLIGVEFTRLELDEIPPPMQEMVKDSYDYALGFPSGKYGCCVMGKDLRAQLA